MLIISLKNDLGLHEKLLIVSMDNKIPIFCNKQWSSKVDKEGEHYEKIIEMDSTMVFVWVFFKGSLGENLGRIT